VFAAGDCTDVPEEKLAFLASSHGELVAKNILALARARRAEATAAAAAAAAATTGSDPSPAADPSPPAAPPAVSLRAWKPSQGLPVAIVTLGRAYAIMCVGPVAAAGWLPTKLKASNLLGFVNKYRTRLGVAEGV
jgi:NADH dehydrogenase FAD-containing subunit